VIYTNITEKARGTSFMNRLHRIRILAGNLNAAFRFFDLVWIRESLFTQQM
jgi:hypothetical protein